MTLDRRALLAAAAALIPGSAYADDAGFAALEAHGGTRIGVAALDTATGKRLAWRAEERFLMCSTFKLSLAAAVLARADDGREDLSRRIAYAQSDLMDVSPITTRNLARGMRVGELCEAAVTYSDNTAAMLLLPIVGGPEGLTFWWRDIGDEVTRLDRREPALNMPDGDKDTTTPAAMLADLREILLGDILFRASRMTLLAWLAASTTGAAMLRAGLPRDWHVGDKTGQGGDGAAGDLAIATPPGRAPILIAAYTAHGAAMPLAAIGGIVARAFA